MSTFSRSAFSGLFAAAVLAFSPTTSWATEALNAPAHCRWAPEGQATASKPSMECLGSESRWAAVTVPRNVTAQTFVDATAGKADAMTVLGMFYLDGPDATRDASMGLDWLQKADNAGSLLALRYLGRVYYDGDGTPKDLAESARFYQAAADRGDAPSMSHLGGMYVSGNGLRQDYAMALHWFRAAAEKDEVRGMNDLGFLYFLGHGVPKSDVDAFHWIRLAAEHGNPDSMQTLAYYYSNGFGVPKDARESLRWQRASVAAKAWTRLPSEDAMQYAYPVEAAAADVVGSASFRCMLEEDRTLQYCHVISEDPPGYGIAKAGRSLLGAFQLAPGWPAGSEVSFPINFARRLGGGTEPRAMADTCAAYAIVLSKQQHLNEGQDWWSRYWIVLSDRYARAAGGASEQERLAPQIAVATQQLSNGKERGWFGQLSHCSMRF